MITQILIHLLLLSSLFSSAFSSDFEAISVTDVSCSTDDFSNMDHEVDSDASTVIPMRSFNAFETEVVLSLAILDRIFPIENCYFYAEMNKLSIEYHIQIINKSFELVDRVNMSYLIDYISYIIDVRLPAEPDFNDSRRRKCFHSLLIDLVSMTYLPRNILEMILNVMSDLLSYDEQCSLYILAWSMYSKSAPRDSLRTVLHLFGLFTKYIPNPIFSYFDRITTETNNNRLTIDDIVMHFGPFQHYLFSELCHKSIEEAINLYFLIDGRLIENYSVVWEYFDALIEIVPETVKLHLISILEVVFSRYNPESTS